MFGFIELAHIYISTILDHHHMIHEYIATDLINALPGNNSVNTVKHATINEAVFSM
jgi:hypothetical protein